MKTKGRTREFPELNPAGPPPWFRMVINRAVEDCFTNPGPFPLSTILRDYFGRELEAVCSAVPLSAIHDRLEAVSITDVSFTFYAEGVLDGGPAGSAAGGLYGIDFSRYLSSPGFPLSIVFGSPGMSGSLADKLGHLPPPGALHRALISKALSDTGFQEKTAAALQAKQPAESRNAALSGRERRYAPAGGGTGKNRAVPALMIQGTSSNAGKSILAAAFCRILLQEGYRVAPFKAQNMALNSFVTAGGGEMGRAQVVQAGACKIDPDVRMNPVLLKPNSDTGSQVILEGKPIGNMKALDYYEHKRRLWDTVTGCYDSLASEYDVIVLEGAGSPGEVNLKAHDIVNMRMAEYARAAVLLTGDIDRGGVFASFIGTLAVLEERERSLIAGYLVNKFRGDASLLQPAFDYVFDYTGKRVLGTVPYIRDLGLPEEDSVSFKEKLYSPGSETGGEQITIFIIDLPHISNFTDIDPLRIEADTAMYIIRTREDFETIAASHPPDALIIPGSKNVIKDLQFLRQAGIADQLKRLAAGGDSGDGDSPEIIGICGGFQMLGNAIRDPYGIESDEEQIAGLGLLDIDTVLAREKTLTQTTGRYLDPVLPVRGYEIHHGRTEIRSGQVIIETENSGIGGVASPKKFVWGTYLHGIFDADEFRHYFLEQLRKRKGLPPLMWRPSYDLESAYDLLADEVRKSVDLDFIFKAAGVYSL